MGNVGLKIGGTAAIMSVQTGAAALPFLLNRCCFAGSWHEVFLSLSNTCSGGLMTGTALMHLLHEATENTEILSAQTAFGLCGVAFLVSWFCFGLLLPKLADISSSTSKKKKRDDEQGDASGTDLEDQNAAKIVSQDHQSSNHSNHHHHHTVPQILSVIFVFALSFHSLFSGLVLGLQSSFSAILSIFLSLLAHKWSEAFAMGSAMARDDEAFSWKKILILVLCPPISTLVGVSSKLSTLEERYHS